jgi:hypothetical protein
MLGMILGLPNEPPIAAVLSELARLGAPHVILNQRSLASQSVRTWWNDAGAGGVMEVAGSRIDLQEVTGAYTRLTNWSSLPEVVANPSLLERGLMFHTALEGWLESTNAVVINRTSVNDTNHSKPYQAMIIRDYFHVPASLVTNAADAVAEFRRSHRQVIYKSSSGERSIVTKLTDEDLRRMDRLASVPVQFQEYVPGTDVRVHVVGDQAFASAIESDAIDYRYDRRSPAKICDIELTADVASRCLELSQRLGLELAGIDLRIADDGRVVCFEVNPSPAYTAFGETAMHAIAAAIARRILGV